MEKNWQMIYYIMVVVVVTNLEKAHKYLLNLTK